MISGIIIKGTQTTQTSAELRRQKLKVCVTLRHLRHLRPVKYPVYEF